jgi:hypothetical protein
MFQLYSSIPQTNSNIVYSKRLKLENKFINVSADFMIKYWPKFAKSYPDIWISVLLSLSPYSVHSLIRKWDEWDESDDTLEKDNRILRDRNSLMSINNMNIEKEEKNKKNKNKNKNSDEVIEKSETSNSKRSSFFNDILDPKCDDSGIQVIVRISYY